MVKRFEVELDTDYDTQQLAEVCDAIQEDGNKIIDIKWITPRFVWVTATKNLE